MRVLIAHFAPMPLCNGDVVSKIATRCGTWFAKMAGMEHLANTPEPPYVAVIFSSTRTAEDNGYAAAAVRMEELAAQQPGYLGIESARSGVGITVSYWSSEADARAFKRVVEHAEVQRRGRQDWYRSYRVRVATVTREYGHDAG